MTNDFLFGSVLGNRRRGGTKTRLSDNVKKIAGTSMPELSGLGQDRSFVGNDNSVSDKALFHISVLSP